MNRDFKTSIVFVIIITAIIGSHFALRSSNASLLALPFSWIAASILGPGPAFIFPNLAAAAQILAYGLFLGRAWINGFFRKKLVVLIVVHIAAILLLFTLSLIRSF
jgi:hypothetical protein